MQYLLLLFNDPKGLEAMPPSAAAGALAAYGAYVEALQKAGALVHSARLRNAGTASTVRVTAGKTEVLDGPFIETREELGGYFLIEAPDLDAALDWAARCPGASHGSIEVRPVWPREDY